MHNSTSTSAPAELRLQLSGEPTAPAIARRAVERKLAHWLDESVMERVRLLVSELVTNCVRHAGIDEDRRIDLRVAINETSVRVEVADPGPGFVMPGQLRCGSGEGGYGLFLVDHHADRWGIEHVPGTLVWFEIEGAPRQPQRAVMGGHTTSVSPARYAA